MAKQILELKVFNEGLSTSVSDLDTALESSTFTQNINPKSTIGRIEFKYRQKHKSY